MAKGWRAWHEDCAAQRAKGDAAKRACRVMSRMLNVQLGRGWARWRERLRATMAEHGVAIEDNGCNLADILGSIQHLIS